MAGIVHAIGRMRRVSVYRRTMSEQSGNEWPGQDVAWRGDVASMMAWVPPAPRPGSPWRRFQTAPRPPTPRTPPRPPTCKARYQRGVLSDDDRVFSGQKRVIFQSTKAISRRRRGIYILSDFEGVSSDLEGISSDDDTRAPAPLTDWNPMKKRELVFLAKRSHIL